MIMFEEFFKALDIIIHSDIALIFLSDFYSDEMNNGGDFDV